jgi:hypothetical protein
MHILQCTLLCITYNSFKTYFSNENGQSTNNRKKVMTDVSTHKRIVSQGQVTEPESCRHKKH